MKLFDFMLDPSLAGTEFSGESWAAWRCVARLIDGDAHLLSETDRALAMRFTGRTVLPSGAPGELAIGAGRRSGKSRFCAVVASWFAAQDYRERLAPGETAVIALAAPDRKQAGLLLDYIGAILNASDILRAEIVNSTADSIELSHSTKIEVLTSSYRSVRGRTLAAAILDECSFLRSDDSALPDLELYRALLPSMLTLGGPLIAISSPHMRRGLMFDLHRKYFANDGAARGLYLQSDSRTLNPTLDAEAIERAIAADPEAGASEYGGEFRSDLSSYVDAETLDAVTVPGRRSLPREYGRTYFAFADPSGGRSDSFTLAISHSEGSRVVLDRLCVAPAPFDPAVVCQEFADVLSAYGLSHVTGDAYTGEWTVSAFSKVGIIYLPSARTKSEIFIEFLPLLVSKSVELLDHQRLRVELQLLERRPRAGGRGDSVDHGRNGHDDCANAAAGSLLLAAAGHETSAYGNTRSVSRSVCDYDPLDIDRQHAPQSNDPRPMHARPILYLN